MFFLAGSAWAAVDLVMSTTFLGVVLEADLSFDAGAGFGDLVAVDLSGDLAADDLVDAAETLFLGAGVGGFFAVFDGLFFFTVPNSLLLLPRS